VRQSCTARELGERPERLLSENFTKLTEVETEAEAATICGFLESQGIHATYDKGGINSAIAAYSGPGGRQEILVRADELDAARAALASIEEPPAPSSSSAR
jgi:hypothetical protein